jgi:uncharacterized membrane protein YhfC
MVDSASITAMIIDIIICIGMPLGCFVYLLVKRQRPLIPFLVGFAVFVVFQLILRVTFMGLIVSTDWYKNLLNNTWLFGMFAGKIPGLFTEVGRFAGYKLLLKNRNEFHDGIAMGVGFAGFDSIFIGGLNYFSSLSLANLINSGQTSQIATMTDAETAGEVVKSLTSTMPLDIYLGGLDRIFIFVIHIALSILVLLGIRKRKLSFLGIAVLAHLVIDGLPEALKFSNLALVIYAGVLAAVSIAFLLRARKQFDPTPPKQTMIK